jgi:hypothetical protein
MARFPAGFFASSGLPGLSGPPRSSHHRRCVEKDDPCARISRPSPGPAAGPAPPPPVCAMAPPGSAMPSPPAPAPGGAASSRGPVFLQGTCTELRRCARARAGCSVATSRPRATRPTRPRAGPHVGPPVAAAADPPPLPPPPPPPSADGPSTNTAGIGTSLWLCVRQGWEHKVGCAPVHARRAGVRAGSTPCAPPPPGPHPPTFFQCSSR